MLAVSAPRAGFWLRLGYAAMALRLLREGEDLTMDRRSFVLSILAMAAGGGSLAASEAAAAPASLPEETKQAVAEMLDDLPLTYAQNWNGSPHWHHRDPRFRHHPRHVRRRRVCRMERDRHGRRVQRCRWVWM